MGKPDVWSSVAGDYHLRSWMSKQVSAVSAPLLQSEWQRPKNHPEALGPNKLEYSCPNKVKVENPLPSAVLGTPRPESGTHVAVLTHPSAQNKQQISK